MSENKFTDESGTIGQASLRDIAEVCGLSKMTVSRALRGSRRVRATTRRKVLETARRMGYVPNRLAASFGRQGTKIVGFVVPELDHNFYSSLMMSIEPILNAEGYLLCLCCSYDRVAKELSEVQALLEWRVDGIVIAPVSLTQSADAIFRIQAMGCPVVLVDRLVPDIEADAVTVDDRDGAFAIVTHLTEEGYRNIAHIGGPENVWTAEERLRGYKEALSSAGIEPRAANIVRGETTIAAGKASAELLLIHSDQPDAIFCYNDMVAVGALMALNQHRIRVPDEVGLAGFANVLYNDVMSVPITTAGQDTNEIGQQCARLLLARMTGKSPTEPVHYVSRTKLLVRNSSLRTSVTQTPPAQSSAEKPLSASC